MINLESAKGKDKKRLGRGISAGQGKTAGRGTKGQKARAGYDLPRRYEGGQTPLSMRLPKLPGFKSIHKKAIILSLDEISRLFKDGEVVTREALKDRGITSKNEPIKVLNNGKLTVKVTLAPEIAASAKVKPLFEKVEVKEEKSETKNTENKTPTKAKKTHKKSE